MEPSSSLPGAADALNGLHQLLTEAAFAPATAQLPDDVLRARRRLGALLARRGRSNAPPLAPGSSGTTVLDELSVEILVAAVGASQDQAQLEQFLSALHRLGLHVAARDLFRSLAASLPDWGFLPPGGTTGASAAGVVGALRRLVTLAPDPDEGTRRFGETVEAAVAEVNAGRFARGVTLLALADEISRGEKVDWAGIEPVKTRAHLSLAAERLKEAAESPLTQPLLRRVMDFFPALGPLGLLEALSQEKRREGRKQLLTLLEAHGSAAREAAFAQLKDSLGAHPAADWFFQRNLLTVLRRIPRATAAPGDAEVEALARLSDPAFPAPLVKEALTNLAQVKTRKGEQVLTTRLTQIEALLTKGGIPAEAATESQQLLDRATASLAAHGTPAALRVVVEHALKGSSAHGDPLGRLQTLATHDLSREPDLVERLVHALRTTLPVKLLGFVSQTAETGSLKLVAALAGTPAPAVRKALAEVEAKFAGQELGRTAARVLRAFDAPRKPEPAAGPALAGPLQVYGLPSVLLALEQSQATGVLSLDTKPGARAGTLALEGGRLRGCVAGRRTGLDGAFELLERPAAGSFVFARLDALRPEDATLPSSVDVRALALEGARRHEELRRASALVPDSARLRATAQRPTRLPDETDATFLGAIWAKATSGATALECEDAVPADAYRVRRVLSHWVEEGSLGVVAE